MQQKKAQKNKIGHHRHFTIVSSSVVNKRWLP